MDHIEPPLNPLEHIDVELTRWCNLKCIHCSTGKGNSETEMTTQEIKTLFTSARELGLKKVGFTGGEPFSRMDKLTSLLKFSDELGFTSHIHSNGTLIDKTHANTVK